MFFTRSPLMERVAITAEALRDRSLWKPNEDFINSARVEDADAMSAPILK